MNGIDFNVLSQTNMTAYWNSTMNKNTTNSSKMTENMTVAVSNYSIMEVSMEPGVWNAERNMTMGGGNPADVSFNDICPTTLRASFSYSRCTISPFSTCSLLNEKIKFLSGTTSSLATWWSCSYSPLPSYR